MAVMVRESVWTENTKRREPREVIAGKRSDVLIIGGGIAGILVGYMLKQAGVDCVIIDKGRICSGVTENTTAKVTMQHGLIYSKLLNLRGAEYTSLYAKAQIKALDAYASLCLKIDCDYKICDSYVYTTDNKRAIEREVRALEHIGVDCSFVENTELPLFVEGAAKMKNQAQILLFFTQT